MSAKVLIIGYDGGTLDVIEPLIKKRQLPTFAKLGKDGAFGELQSIYPPVSAPAWVSFMTGKNPGKHSVFNFTLKKNSTYYVEPALSTSVDGITLWELLSSENKRVAVINVPLTYPPRKINGIMVSGLGTPGEESDFIYPSSFTSELKNAVPGYKIDVGWAEYEDDRINDFLGDLNYLTQKTYEVAKYCIRKEDWDLFMVVFIGPDRIQHRLWNSMPTGSCCGNGHLDTLNRTEQIMNYFNFLDNLIGSLINESGDESTTIILSDHGFGPFVKDIDLNNWLAYEGFLKYSSKELTPLRHLIKYATRLSQNVGISREWIMKRIEKRIDVYKYLEKSSPHISHIDWAQTKAFCFSSHFIHINLRGRERHGIVNPGKEYEDLRDEIISKLYSLRDPETGRQVIKKIQRIEEVYTENSSRKAPDLIITEYDEAGYVGCDRIFRNDKDRKIFMKTANVQEGVHRRNGFFIASGKNLKKKCRIKGAKILDLFPTILFILGLAIPNDVDGRVLTDIFEENVAEPCFRKEVEVTSDPYNLSEDEKAKMVKKLKGLGYL